MPNLESFNLVDDPWIPVLGHSLKSLREVFEDKSLSRLSGENAVDKIVVFRLLLTIAHAAITDPDTSGGRDGINDAEDWRKLTPGEISQCALAYLDKWHDSFYFGGEKPFMQFPQLEEAFHKVEGKDLKKKELKHLSAYASDNMALFSGWEQTGGFSIPEIVVFLLRVCCFGFSGKRYHQAVKLAPFHEKKASGSSGPLLGMFGYLHSYMLGDTLLDSLILNMLALNDIEAFGVFSRGLGRPFWEKMPKNETEDKEKTYLRNLFPLEKFVLIREDGVIMTDGIRYGSVKDGFIDPALSISNDPKKGAMALLTHTDKLPWREFSALLASVKGIRTEAEKNRNFISLALEKLDDEKTYYVWTAGVQVKNQTGEQKICDTCDYVDSVFGINQKRVNEANWVKYADVISKLDNYNKLLRGTVSGYFSEFKMQKPANLLDQASEMFWERMNKHGQELIHMFFGENADLSQSEAFLKQSRAVVLAIYDAVCPRVTDTQIYHWIEHKPFFNFNDPNTTKTRKAKNGKSKQNKKA